MRQTPFVCLTHSAWAKLAWFWSVETIVVETVVDTVVADVTVLVKVAVLVRVAVLVTVAVLVRVAVFVSVAVFVVVEVEVLVRVVTDGELLDVPT